MIRHLLVATTALCLTLVASPSYAGKASTCANDLRLDNGTCSIPVPMPPQTPAQRQEKALQDARIAALTRLNESRASATSGNTRFFPAQSFPPPWNTVNIYNMFQPLKYKLPAFVHMTIKKEGEGNKLGTGKNKWYTCGPSASWNVERGLYKAHTKKYPASSEAQWEKWEGTTTAGTSRANVAAALTKHLGQWTPHQWWTTRPSKQSELMAYVENDIWYNQRPVIMNVNTGFLEFLE